MRHVRDELSRLTERKVGDVNMVNEVGHVGGTIMDVSLNHNSMDNQQYAFQLCFEAPEVDVSLCKGAEACINQKRRNTYTFIVGKEYEPALEPTLINYTFLCVLYSQGSSHTTNMKRLKIEGTSPECRHVRIQTHSRRDHQLSSRTAPVDSQVTVSATGIWT